MPVPAQPKIYHITHIANLAKIVGDGLLWSDAERINQNFGCTLIGMSEIKRRRLEELEVGCHPGTKVGEYVPFYFCPRAVMLYLLHRGNHPDLTYNGGQQPIMHLQADLYTVIAWANGENRRWAFSSGNAGAFYVDFYKDPAELAKLDWASIPLADWREPIVKEAKQSEFLVEGSFPWSLIEYIGVINDNVSKQVADALTGTEHIPTIGVQRGWYY